jgi:hypothetical protein
MWLIHSEGSLVPLPLCSLGSDIWRLNSRRREDFCKQMPTLKVELSDGTALGEG